MLQSLYSGIAGLRTHQQQLSVVANNLANVNTVAFKGSRALFQDSLSQTMKPPTQSTATSGGSNGIQIGLGVGLSTVTAIFSQGALQATGLPSDLAIEGDGFFVVADPASGAQTFSRAGALALDSLGNLVDSNGSRIQGSLTGVSGDPYADVVIQGPAANPMVAYSIESTGRVLMQLSDGTTAVAGFIALTRFTNPQALLRIGKNQYQETPEAGNLFTGYEAPGSNGLGALRAGFLEMSNVDLAQEFTDMIRAQRGLQANSRIITTSDEVLQELISLKR